MNPISHLLKNFLQSGNKPRSQRETSALLDESRSILVSQLPTTGHHIQNFSDGEIDGILAGGKGAMARAHSIHREKYATAAPAPRSAAKQDRISELANFITQPRKPIAKHLAKAAPAPANRFKTCSDSIVQQAATHRSSPPADRAEAKAELEARGFTVTASGIISKSFRKY